MKRGIKGLGTLIIVLFLLLYHYIPAKALTINLRVAYCCNMPPYQFLEEGKPVGMHVDILNQIAADQNLVLDYMPMEKYSDCMAALKRGEVDLVLGALFDESNQEQMTEEVSSSTLCLVVENDLLKGEENPDLSGITAVFEYGTASYSLISKIGASKYMAMGNQSDIFMNHKEGKSKAIIGVKDSILWQIYDQNLENSYSISNNYMSTVRFGILTQVGDHNLRRMLNNGLMQLRTNGEYERIYEKWTIEESIYDRGIFIRRGIYIFSIAAALWCVYAVFNHRIQTVLKMQVEEKTRELKGANAELERHIIQIQDSNDLQRCLIENSPNGMVLFDQKYNIRAMNNSACLMAGIDTIAAQERKENSSILDITFFKNIVERIGQKSLEEGGKRIDRIVTAEGQGGELRTYQCNVLPAADPGIGGGILLTVSDITKEEQEKRLAFEKEKGKALNRLVAGIAHEVKNPLMSIRTFAALLVTRRGDQQVQDMFAEFVPDEVDRISRLIDGLLNYAKPAKREVSMVDVERAIEECRYLTQAVVKQGYIKVEVQTEAGLMIQVDKNQLKQVLINIILNGIESMERKLNGESEKREGSLFLKIESRAEDQQVVIMIEDQGCGMTEKEIRRCTDPFFTTKSTGSGLGLALSKSYIEENGGVLYIESKQFEYTKITMKFNMAAAEESLE